MSLSHLEIERHARQIRVDRVSLKESVFCLATITGAAVEVNWRAVPHEHYMVFLRGLQQKERSKEMAKSSFTSGGLAHCTQTQGSRVSVLVQVLFQLHWIHLLGKLTNSKFILKLNFKERCVSMLPFVIVAVCKLIIELPSRATFIPWKNAILEI